MMLKLTFFFLFISCQSEDSLEVLVSGLSVKKQEQAREGRALYLANCIACHSPDPRKFGKAPPLQNITKERLVKKLRFGVSQDKRLLMPPFPQLLKEADQIHLFLNLKR